MALDPTSPFTWRQGRDAGIPQRRLTSTRFRQVVRGVYVAASTAMDPVLEGRAALLVAGDRAFLSHHQAARLYGAVVPDTPILHAGVPPGVRRSTHQDVAVHRSTRTPARFRGLPVTDPPDTFLDLAATLPLVDLVVLGDSLVRRRRTTPEALVQAADLARGRGVRLARRAARLVREGVDSPMESRSRMLRVLSGLPELETDIRFYDDDGALVRRLDAETEPPGQASSTTAATTSSASSSGRTIWAGGRSSRTSTGASSPWSAATCSPPRTARSPGSPASSGPAD